MAGFPLAPASGTMEEDTMDAFGRLPGRTGRARPPLVALLVLALLLPMIPGPGAAQTTPTGQSSHVAVTGQSVTWGAPWTQDVARSMSGDAFDILLLVNGPHTVVIGLGDFQAEAARGLMLGYLGADTDQAIPIDAGTTGTSAYWLDTLPLGGVNHGAFTVAEGVGTAAVTLTMVVAPISTFGPAVTTAQTAIAIDGQPILAGVDGAGLQAALPAQDPEPAATPTPFLPVGSWVDPVFGVTVEWGQGWQPASERNDTTFMLMHPAAGLFLDISALPRRGSTPSDWAASLSTPPPAITDWETEPATIGPANVFVEGTADGIRLINEVLFLDDGQTIVLDTLGIMTADPDVAVATYRESVRIAGRVPLEGWVASATAAPGSAPPSAGGAGSEQDAGVIANGEYVSPQYGVEVRWTARWTLDPAMTPAARTDPAGGMDMLFLALADNDSVHVAVETVAPFGVGIEEIVAFAAGEEAIEGVYGPEADVLLSTASPERGAVAVLIRAGLVPMVVCEEYILVNGGTALVMLQFMAPIAVLDTVLPAAHDITVAGTPILTLFTAEQIRTAATAP